jgi:hypothetical protein
VRETGAGSHQIEAWCSSRHMRMSGTGAPTVCTQVTLPVSLTMPVSFRPFGHPTPG